MRLKRIIKNATRKKKGPRTGSGRVPEVEKEEEPVKRTEKK